MIAVHVAGGTGAGSKRPPGEKPRNWIHLCKTRDGASKLLSGYWTMCPDCKTLRPR